MKARRIVSLMLAVIMIIGVLPMNLVHAAEYEIKRIEITRNYDEPKQPGTYYITITGEGLRGVPIRYMPINGDGQRKLLTNPDPASDDSYVQFPIDPNDGILDIMIGSEIYPINESDMPTINSISPTNFNLSDDEDPIEIEGNKFENIDGEETKFFINTKDQSSLFEGIKTKVALTKSFIDNNLSLGYQNLSIVNEKNENDVKIITRYNYNKSFRVFESINIKDEDIYIFPNRGKVGTEVTIEIAGDREQYSVFFLENETSEFLYENLGEDARYPETNTNNGIIKVKVPEGLVPGKTYKIILTNNIEKHVDQSISKDKDLTENINKQENIGEFYVIDASVGPEIQRIVPNEGTSAGYTNVSIHGRRFEELDNIDGLELPNKDISDKKVISGEGNSTKLQVIYNTEGDTKYNGVDVSSITRDFLVTIGRDALFEEGNIDKNVFTYGDKEEDTLYVQTRTLGKDDLDDLVKDVSVLITTTIEAGGQTYTFTEMMVEEDGFVFLPEYTEPVIIGVTPDKIQVEEGESENRKVTKDKTILSVQGENFNVYTYTEDGSLKTNFPRLVIGGNGESTGEIFIEKREDGVFYKDANDNEYGPYKDAIFEVLDRNGDIVDGVGGNITGNFIVVTIPQDIEISSETINSQLPIAVANPKRDTDEKGYYIWEDFLITFVEPDSSPIIENVTPYIVTVDGGEEIIIEGRNFDDGIKVFIDGKEVQGVTRDIDRQTTRGTLQFEAPEGREGETILQVMNPNGGSDTHQFIYVETLRLDPSITSIAPSKGTEDTLVVIKGNNFLKPDQTADDSGLGFYKLIGTRVSLGEDDVNRYAESGELEDYETPQISDERLMYTAKDSWTNKNKLMLSPYYRSASIYDKEDNPYSTNVDYEGNPVISGEENIYTFKLIGESIKAIDQDGQSYDVESSENSIKLTDVEDNSIEFIISFDYTLFSIGKDEFGGKHLRVADYYDSLILEEGNYYIIEVDDMDRVTISDGKNDIYNIVSKEDDIYAQRGSEEYKVTVNNGSIEFNDREFTFKTPYYEDPSTGVITGHRAKVKNKNEIWVTIPRKSIPGFYDVKVTNPDTKSDIVRNGFEYLQPQSRPAINYINPSQGSVDGGYEIVIYGEGFEDNTEVYISGVPIPTEDVKVNKETYKSITVTVPQYPGDIESDFITDKKFVPVVVVNEDGGSAYRDDLFAYVIASSRPRIDKINPVSASAAGGEVIEIWGYDFRYFEPYKGEIPKEGDNNYEDIDRNGRWTNMRDDGDCKEKIDIDHPLFNEYCASPVLPTVFFGNKEAKIVEFSEGYIKVIAPSSTIIDDVDVYIVNNDAGTSNKVTFTYEGSNPTITSIVPSVGKKQGGLKIDIIGRNFKESNINLFNEDGQEDRKTTYLVRFGEITNRNVPREDIKSGGRIDRGRATVNLAGGLKVEYKLEDGSPVITVTITENNKTYIGKYNYDSGIKYINLKSLKDNEGNSYPGFELIKVEVSGGRLLIDRGYSPGVSETLEGQLEVVTPSYYTIGNVNVVVENPDGISNSVIFEYKNPDSHPRIDNITRDGQDPILGDDGETYVIPVHYQGGSIITIEGDDFREGATIQIGNVLDIPSSSINYDINTGEGEKDYLTFIMPEVPESALGRQHAVVVINDDGGTASSEDANNKWGAPIKVQFLKGESNPSIESIFPDRGPTRGGTTVIIKGNDFRETMEGFEGKTLKVFFGDVPVPQEDIKVIDYKTIEVITPPGTPGEVEVKVENPDGTPSRPSGRFTYISGPTIIRVEDPVTENLITHISVKGGREIGLSGYEFMEGARVVFNPVLRKAELGETGNFIYIEGVAYVLESGNEGSNFTFIDEETVLITTPEGKIGDKGVMIINPDGGASPVYDIIYDLPGLDAPEDVVAEVVFDKYIRIHWNQVTDAEFYEIYEVDKRGDEEFIGSTDLTSFLYKDIKPRTSYRFLIKAVGEFGSSKGSMVSNKVKTGKDAGYEDEYGDLGEYTAIDRSGNILNINLGHRDYDGLKIDLTKTEYKGTKEVIVSIPIDLVEDAKATDKLTLIGEDYELGFSPNVFWSSSYRKYSGDSDAGVRLKIYYNTGNTNLNGATSLSPQLVLEGSFYSGKDVEIIYSLSGNINLKLNYDINKANLRKITRKTMYYYNEGISTWIELPLAYENSFGEIAGYITNLGRYTILGYRR